MSLIAVIGAALQLLLIVLKKWFEYGDEKKAERKALYEEAKKAISSRDASAVTACFDRMRRI